MSPTLLSDIDIRALTEQADPPLLSGYIDFDAQLQPSGFDVTVKSIAKLSGRSRLGGPYKSKIASEEPVDPRDGVYELAPGAYTILLNEITAFPLTVAGMALPRSTLFRCGGSLATGLWDPGFHGRGRLALRVDGVEAMEVMQDAPFAQLIFFKVAGVEKGFAFNEYYER